jgi:hypothetical protein
MVSGNPLPYSMYVCMYVCMCTYVCVCVCMYVVDTHGNRRCLIYEVKPHNYNLEKHAPQVTISASKRLTM